MVVLLPRFSRAGAFLYPRRTRRGGRTDIARRAGCAVAGISPAHRPRAARARALDALRAEPANAPPDRAFASRGSMGARRRLESCRRGRPGVRNRVAGDVAVPHEVVARCGVNRSTDSLTWRPPIFDFRLPAADFPLPTSHFPLPTSHFPAHGPRPTAHGPRPTAHSPQPTASSTYLQTTAPHAPIAAARRSARGRTLAEREPAAQRGVERLLVVEHALFQVLP
ncbi:Uncharacterised protein [Burkholderia pseudomallei]|nr:Uncharacterised protein [Burkholderia pseudomallei]CAJ5556586.1 Uncharacterised protein [Burkholderia pseudomallei]CAJ6397382.1 Uncharacterised protein [Burkholderia pseudomallei]CAJ6796869.1 Uncharacterised protein [Burkholderia pseudomallei]CAJ6871628.1 Uncharacterised protein [Burkholderia pseudomallei]